MRLRTARSVWSAAWLPPLWSAATRLFRDRGLFRKLALCNHTAAVIGHSNLVHRVKAVLKPPHSKRWREDYTVHCL